MSDGLAKLIDPWVMTVTVDGGERTQHFPPLVDMLREMIAPSSGATMGGANDPASRSVVNIQALDLLEHMEDVTRGWLDEWGVQKAGELKLDLRGFWDRLHTLHRTDAIDERKFEELQSYPDTWATRIWDQVDPPMKISLRGVACPRCGRGKWASDAGDMVDNLIVLWPEGLEPTATCQWVDCRAIWVGENQLVELGTEAGLEVDVVALREARSARHAKMTRL